MTGSETYELTINVKEYYDRCPQEKSNGSSRLSPIQLFQFTDKFSSDISVLIHCSDSAHSIEFISRQQKVRCSTISKFNVDP